jgi:hypothetical protein
MNANEQPILVRKRGSDLFLIGDYDWTSDQENARRFSSPAEAIAHCSREQIATAQIVIRADSPGAPDVIVPIEFRVNHKGSSASERAARAQG